MTSRIGTKGLFQDGFTLIEVLVASVILFAGLGAVLKAYSMAVMALDASADTLASCTLLREKAVELDLAAVAGEGAFTGGNGRSVVEGVDYLWDVRTSRRDITPDIMMQSSVIRVSRFRGGMARTLECEWAVFRDPARLVGSP